MFRGDPDSEQFSLLYYRSGRLIKVDAVNAPRDYMAVRKILEVGRIIAPRIGADTDVALKESVRAGA
ncbi:oxidoreductase C-terminal domain-containing protein [Streptomyces sp. NPDC046900]|uniref:oxidoreductase C-terminal domain-containing protein n=1 Tax=Streptomyces sp. NPDC046900 TaxID=3155473 RepID=UPI0033FFE344